jgi:hypothetical protein
MKKIILLLLLNIPIIAMSQDLGDYYNSKTDNNADKINFGIRNPLGFIEEKSKGKEIKNWVKKDFEIKVFIKENPKKYSSKNRKYFIDILKANKLKLKYFKLNTKSISKSSYIQIDNHPGIEVFSKQKSLFKRTVLVFFNNYYFEITMQSKTEDILDVNKSLFKDLLNSIIFYDQYSNPNPVVGKWKIIKETKGGSKKE